MRSSKIKIISNIHEIPTIVNDNVTIEICKYPKAKNSWSTVIKYFFKSFKYNYFLLNYVDFDVFAIAFLKFIIPFNRCKLITLDLIILVPQKSIKDRMYKIIKTVLFKNIHFSMIYFKNTEGYQKYYKIKPNKFKYVPYKINSYNLVINTPISDEGYIFTGGKSRRDFATFIEAIKDLPYPVKIITPVNKELLINGSYIDEKDIPPQVELIHDDGTPESFMKYIAASKLVVLPIKKENISASGLGVYIVSMALKKCVIISKGPAVDDIITPDMAYLVPPGDVTALRNAIKKVYTDHDLRNRLAENGYNYAMSLKDEVRLKESIVEVIRTDFFESF